MTKAALLAGATKRIEPTKIDPTKRHSNLCKEQRLQRIADSLFAGKVDAFQFLKCDRGGLPILRGPNGAEGRLETPLNSPGATVIRWKMPAGCVLADHWHDEMELIVVLQGKLRLTGVDWEATVGPHESFVIKPSVVHAADTPVDSEMLVFFIPAATVKMIEDHK